MVDPLAILDRAPAPVRRLARRIANGQGVAGRVADRIRFRFSDDQVPALPEVSRADVRLVIGPANTAGQGYEWARAVERLPGAPSALAVHGVVPDPFGPHVDLDVPMAVFLRSRPWHDGFGEYLAQQTHVIWESGISLLGRRFGSDVRREAAWLQERGVSGALLFHGSDIRPPARHAAEHRWSPFRDPRAPVELLADGAEANASLIAKAGLPVFVSTPDLLQWVPGAVWCPVVVDPERWRVAPVAERRDRPLVVVHAPSQKWLKGTDRIEPTLRRLHAEGLIDYRQIIGVPHASMPAFYAEADVVLDQFLLGSYGVAACEAMASGRLVMSHVDKQTRAAVRERTGRDLPIYESTIESLESDVRRVAADPDALVEARESGPAFVDAVHDGRYSAGEMAAFLGVSE